MPSQILDALASDLRYALRTLRKSPAFSTMAIATLALGIGANTAIFSVVDSVVLRPLGYRGADRLYSIHESVPRFAHIAPLVPVNALHFQEWRKNGRSFEQMALVGGASLNLTGDGEPERLNVGRVSPVFFPMLGIRMQLGRAFLEEEDLYGKDGVVILDDALWRRRFAADPGIVGRKVILSGQPYEVVGVLPPDFHFPKLSQLYAMAIAQERPQIWKPFAVREWELEMMGDFNFVCIGRLRAGVSMAQALSELNVLEAGIARRVSDKTELRGALVPLQDQITGRSRSGLQLILAAVGVVLLIGCVNIANLLLARGSGRRREIAIRSAVGAGRGRLGLQMLVESLVLSGLGGLGGVGIAFAALGLIRIYAPADIPRMDEVHLDARVLLFTLAVSTAAGLLFGLLPAWRAAHTDPQEAMKSASRSATSGRGSGRVRTLLVGLEVGLSAICLIVGGLLLHSFVNLLRVDPGFAANRIVTVELNLPENRYPDFEKRGRFVRAALEKIQALPGVESAGMSNMLPLGGEGGNNLLDLEGANLPAAERPLADVRSVNPDYFRTMSIPLRQGRIFEESDRKRQVTLVSTLTAERVWPGQNPIGKRFRIGGENSPLMEIVGIVGDVRGISLNQSPSLTIYLPYWQRFFGHGSLAVKTASDPAAIFSAVRTAIRQVDRELPVPAFQTMEELVSESVAQRRFQVGLVLLFAMAATLLASLGIYGVVSYSVAQRTTEMGIRLALGAQPGQIRRMVLEQSLRPVIAGAAAGVIAALAFGRLAGSLMFGVSAMDPITICSVTALLFTVASVASFVPARRATRVDPINALRWE